MVAYKLIDYIDKRQWNVRYY